MNKEKPLKIGTEIKPYGKIKMVGYVGERYYWLINKNGHVSMLPADLIESIAKTNKNLNQ